VEGAVFCPQYGLFRITVNKPLIAALGRHSSLREAFQRSIEGAQIAVVGPS
jgi:hypothetical protein